MVDDPFLTTPPVIPDDPEADDSSSGVELEAFSATHATAALDRELAALEPFRAVRFKQHRVQTQVEAHREAFARYLPAVNG